MRSVLDQQAARLAPSSTVIDGVRRTAATRARMISRPDAVALRMNDAAAAMRRLQAEVEPPRRRRGRIAAPCRRVGRSPPAPRAGCGATTAASQSPSPAASVSAHARGIVVGANAAASPPAPRRSSRPGAERRLRDDEHRQRAPGAAPSSGRRGRRRDDDCPSSAETSPVTAPASARPRGAPLARRRDRSRPRGRHRLQRAADLRQRDPLHVRAQIARPHELDLRMLDRRRCRSSSIRSAARPARAPLGDDTPTCPRSSRRSRPPRPPPAGIRDAPARRRPDSPRAARGLCAAVKRSCTSQWPAQAMILTSVSCARRCAPDIRRAA